METFRIDEGSDRDYRITVHVVGELSKEWLNTLLDVDLQTFTGPTFSPHMVSTLLHSGQVYVLRADDHVIGGCICIRRWEQPDEAMFVWMGLRPGWRGHGLGQHFVRDVLAMLCGDGVCQASLLVGHRNQRALRVYADAGFVEVERFKLDAKGDDILVHQRIDLRQNGA